MHFYSRGSGERKRIGDRTRPGRAGDGSGNWWLVLTTDLAIEPLAYIRTTDGFVTNMHEVAAETQEGANRYHVPFFNPGKNRNQVSRLRLINPGRGSASIEITGVDDEGRAPPLGTARLTLGAGMARMLDARQLETGGSGLSGRLGAGTGKWRLSISANQPILVMSLLSLPSGHLTNLSRGQDGAGGGTPPPPPSTAPGELRCLCGRPPHRLCRLCLGNRRQQEFCAGGNERGAARLPEPRRKRIGLPTNFGLGGSSKMCGHVLRQKSRAKLWI